MKRYNIAQHAKKGAQKRWSTNFHTPAVKKARKERVISAKAVIVILASGKDGLHFPHQRTWHEWAMNSMDVSFAVFVEDHVTFQRECSPDQWTFWRPLLCPLQSSSAWGQFSLVYAELLALKWAGEQFIDAEWFYVVSGDSVPTKSTKAFVRGPLCRKSAVGFTGYHAVSAIGGTLIEHSQWKVLSKTHVNVLVEHLVQSRCTMRQWKAVVMEEKRKLCCESVPDEWLIGTFLRTQDRKVDWLKGKCIMVQCFVQGVRLCCRKNVCHAKALNGLELRRLYQEAWDDPASFAIRKVDHASYFLKKNV